MNHKITKGSIRGTVHAIGLYDRHAFLYRIGEDEGLEWAYSDTSLSWGRSARSFSGQAEIRAAITRFWPAVLAATTKPDLHWSFHADREDVDIARVLREAYAAGALEVTIRNNGESQTWLHHSMFESKESNPLCE